MGLDGLGDEPYVRCGDDQDVFAKLNIMNKLENDALRERSGTVKINSKLVSFLYVLLRDHIAFGNVEALVRDSMDSDVVYTNGWLAKYAEDLANRLQDK